MAQTGESDDPDAGRGRRAYVRRVCLITEPPKAKSWGILWCMSRFWCLMRYLIRLAKTKFDDWFNGKGDARGLAESVFRPTKAQRNTFKGLFEDSTYLLKSHLDEIMTAAAHLLAGNDPKMEARYLIRIMPQDAKAVGLQENDYSIGNTGFPRLIFVTETWSAARTSLSGWWR